MSSKVVSIFKYMPREMGQCPECRGYVVEFNMPIPDTASPADHAEWEEQMKGNRDAGWHCLNCDCYF